MRVIVAMCLLLAVLAAGGAELLRATAKGDGNAIRVRARDDVGYLVVRSRKGIGSAEVGRVGAKWPAKVVLQLHLKGLENLSVTSGKDVLRVAVSSTKGNPIRVSLIQDSKEVKVEKESVYWSAPTMVAKEKRIPLVDGYFEFVVPAKLLEGNPQQIKIEWIDFYRG